MRLLHTGDWHLGKVLKGFSRLDEQHLLMAEIVEVARREAVDAVVVAGDVFESSAPPPEAQALAWATLLSLRDLGAEVIVVAGNHDHAATFDALRPLWGAVGVSVVGLPRRPDDGGVLEFEARSTGETVRCCLLPFLSQRYVVKSDRLMSSTEGEQIKQYESRYAAMVEALDEGAPSDVVRLIVAHATIVGGRLGGGERTTQTGFEYQVPAAVFPVDVHYVALGHLHRHQRLGGARPVVYAGSPLQLDFGEEDDHKGVVVVEVTPSTPAATRFVELTSGRRLRTVHGRLRDLEDLAGTTGDDLLRVVLTDKARVGLADDVRALFPLALEVQLDRGDEAESPGPRRPRDVTRTPQQLFAEFLAAQRIDDERLVHLFADLLRAED